jgi:hypothetical protein
MITCDTCGNHYERAFTVRTHDGRDFTFDSIECAAEGIAPRCPHCNCRILGHGIQYEDDTYCCASCLRASGVEGATDNLDVSDDTSKGARA